MKLLHAVVLVSLICVALIYFQFKKWTDGQGPLSESIVIEIPKGAASQKVADILFEHHVIVHPLMFRIFLKFEQTENSLKAGEYAFDGGVSMRQVMDKLVKGDVLYHKLTIPEGYTVSQILSLLAEADDLSGDVTDVPAEGSFLPETYTYQKGEQRAVIINKAVTSLQEKLQIIWDGRDEALPYKNMQEMLIMASIIEKETGIGSERSQVASVFVNRLRKGMLLQTDPTVIYALTQGKEELGRSLTRQDLQVDNSYNTYKYAGLPPTPICNPGEEAIWAAAHPAQTDYLYFVANGQGGHNFAKTLKEHNQNVADWKKIR